MRKLLLLVFVAMLCVPSYGSMLVYKTTTTATIVGDSGPEKQTQKGVLVLDVTTATQTVNAAQQITYGDNEQRTKVVAVTFTTSGNSIAADYSSSDTDAVLFGKVAQTLIGAAGSDKESVAKSLKGSMLIGLGTADLGSGTFTATLDSKGTKTANATEGGITAVVATIVSGLADKGFVDQPDAIAPTPNPMTFASDPNATSNTSITMTATTATDADSNPVQYFFTNVTDTGHNSSWQSSPVFLDTGLTPDTNYTYTVKARDSAPVPNETAASAPATTRTPKTADTNAPTPNPMQFATGGEPNGITASEISMTAALATDAQGVNAYYFTCANDANFNSGWLSATTDATNWTASTRTYIATGLAPATTYGFKVKARDNALVANVTADSNMASATTKTDVTAPTPNPMTFATAPEPNGAGAIYMVATTATDDTNSAAVEYDFIFVSLSSGAGGVTSGWQASPVYQNNGLDPNKEYGYRVKARDKSHNETGLSGVFSATTAKSIADRLADAIAARNGATTTPTYQPITVTVPTGTYNEDVVIAEPNITLNSASGSANTLIQLQTHPTGIALDDGCKLGGSTGHGFTIKGGTGTISMITADDTTEVSFCDINSASAAGATAARGVNVGTADVVTITGNNFGTGASDSAIYLAGTPSKDVTISNNTCDSPASAFFVSLDSADCCAVTITGNTTDVGIDVGVGGVGTKVNHLTISSNTFNNGSGIALFEGTASVQPNRLLNTAITGNTFSAGSNAYALLIPTTNGLEPNDVNWATVTFTQNVILRVPGGTTKTVDNQVGAAQSGDGKDWAAILDANDNYWGDPTGPTGGCTGAIGASISTFVTYQPFWTNQAKTVDANCPG